MEIIELNSKSASIELTRKELTVLANAINEAREAIEEWEFSTRVGAGPVEAEDLRQKLKALLVSMSDVR